MAYVGVLLRDADGDAAPPFPVFLLLSTSRDAQSPVRGTASASLTLWHRICRRARAEARDYRTGQNRLASCCVYWSVCGWTCQGE